jgi:hypothetical protein
VIKTHQAGFLVVDSGAGAEVQSPQTLDPDGAAVFAGQLAEEPAGLRLEDVDVPVSAHRH